MRMIRSLTRRPLGVLAAVALATAFASACYSVAPVAEPTDDTDLDGKVIYIVPRSRTHGVAIPYAIEKTRYRRFAGRSFLVGTVVAPDEKNPARTVGSTVWVAVDEIEAIYPFKSVQELRKNCPGNAWHRLAPPTSSAVPVLVPPPVPAAAPAAVPPAPAPRAAPAARPK